jgi:hypothetical protein
MDHIYYTKYSCGEVNISWEAMGLANVRISLRFQSNASLPGCAMAHVLTAGGMTTSGVYIFCAKVINSIGTAM